MRVVGADWAGRRWLCVSLDPQGVGVTGIRSFAEVIEHFAEAQVIAVDIPIGLPEAVPQRRAEEEARRLVIPSTVFPTYPAAAYECDTHAEAVHLCRTEGWPGISRQSYGLWKRIQEVASHADRVHEVHPEVSFWAMNGEAKLGGSKHTWNGFFERRGLLARSGIVIGDQLPENLPAVDVLDASAAAWTARRIANGEARTLPADPGPYEPRITY
jgi:predicted RNase H-like nuclease